MRAKTNHGVLWATSVAALFAFATSSYFLHHSLKQLTLTAPPEDTSRRIDLSGDWSYAPDAAGRAPGDAPSLPETGWKSFDPSENWSAIRGLHFFAPKFSGKYWLRTQFEIRYPIQTPALVLGEIPGSYRLFLNGHLIGESTADDGEPTPYAVFDPSYFNLIGPNQITVSVRENAASFIGFAKVPEVGAYIGDFNDVRKTVSLGMSHGLIAVSTFFAACCGVFGMILIVSLTRALALLSSGAQERSTDKETEPAAEPHPIQQQLIEAHKKIAALVKSKRSSLYVASYTASGDGNSAGLEAVSLIGDTTLIRQSRPIYEDLIGTACKKRKPWLIRDIGDVVKLGSRANYRSRSCMIIPLCSKTDSSILGAITLADKEASVVFSEQDLALAVEASSKLVELLDTNTLIRSRRA
ncbi:MAG: hypothetical protein P4M08_13110 [Oligoflexia bacterium]|nr:hypothetical protein [Oligoflexia bacterium]